MKLFFFFCFTFILSFEFLQQKYDIDYQQKLKKFFNIQPPIHNNMDGHTNNWAVLVCTSRFWFNYRHIANTLSLYRAVKRFGIPDSQIILMLADDVACNPRNRYAATVFNAPERTLDLYGGNEAVEVDYRGYDVNVETFIRLLTNRLGDNVSKNKKLLTDERSNVLVYMTGHGGNEFLKFQDAEEISSRDLADAFQQMKEKKRFHELLFIIDTCQANTLYSQFYTPNLIASGSSEKDENSYSYLVSNEIGVAVIDRYTFYILDYLEKNDEEIRNGVVTLNQLFSSLDPGRLFSNPGVRKDLFQRDFDHALITDFFGNVQLILQVKISKDNLKRLPSLKKQKKKETKEEFTIEYYPVYSGSGFKFQYKKQKQSEWQKIWKPVKERFQELHTLLRHYFHSLSFEPEVSTRYYTLPL